MCSHCGSGDPALPRDYLRECGGALEEGAGQLMDPNKIKTKTLLIICWSNLINFIYAKN